MLTVEQTKDEPACPACGAGVLFECVACSQSNCPNSQESRGFKPEHPAFAFRECEDSHAGEPVPPTIAGVPPELFAQQIAVAMRYADAPLTHDQFVTLVLYLKARAS